MTTSIPTATDMAARTQGFRTVWLGPNAGREPRSVPAQPRDEPQHHEHQHGETECEGCCRRVFQNLCPFAGNRAVIKQIAGGQRSTNMNFDLRRASPCKASAFRWIGNRLNRRIDIRRIAPVQSLPVLDVIAGQRRGIATLEYLNVGDVQASSSG